MTVCKNRIYFFQYQLHAHFTGKQLEVDRIGESLKVILIHRYLGIVHLNGFQKHIGSTTEPSSYVIGSFKSDSFSTGFDISSSLNDIKHQLFTQRTNLISDMTTVITNDEIDRELKTVQNSMSDESEHDRNSKSLRNDCVTSPIIVDDVSSYFEMRFNCF